jgi:hypothetical protein
MITADLVAFFTGFLVLKDLVHKNSKNDVTL